MVVGSKGVGRARGSALLERAALLGLPVARLGEMSAPGVVASRLGDAPPLSGPEDLLVVDLSSLWAGPLCGDLLAVPGRVVKVESSSRPDGARRGPASFFDLLNGAKRSVALDFNDPNQRAPLGRLVHSADVVIEASRPRRLEQLGIVAADMVASGPRLWVSITAYGRSGAGSRSGSETTPPRPADSSPGPRRIPCSAAMPSPIPSRA